VSSVWNAFVDSPKYPSVSRCFYGGGTALSLHADVGKEPDSRKDSHA
jgi:hypothetical protein